MNEKIHHEVCSAYSDSNEFSNEPRNLSFLASEAVSVDDAIEIMTDALSYSGGGYNNFEPSLLEYFDNMDVTLQLAREGSVCVYVIGVEKDTKLKWYTEFKWWRNALKADEVDWDGDKVRVWWD